MQNIYYDTSFHCKEQKIAVKTYLKFWIIYIKQSALYLEHPQKTFLHFRCGICRVTGMVYHNN